ncbi:hypothetical protein [Flaviaesturariibacter terrae]
MIRTQSFTQEQPQSDGGFRMAPAVISGILVLLFFVSIIYVLVSSF